MNDLISEQLEELRRRYPDATVDEAPDGSMLVTVPNFPLPPGWSRPRVRVRFAAPVGYPVARPDSFWTDPDLRLQSGASPANTNPQAPWSAGEQFLWFSWHPAYWDPQKDSLATFLGVIDARFREVR
jgi:hypothetical protein